MTEKSEQVFIIGNQDLESLPVRPFRLGLFGKTLEDALQTLVEKYPGVLPGGQMDPGSDDPPRFALLRREAPVSGWSLDHLMVDQNGVLTLVEAKLTQNPESRREVVGQIMEYAANARETWTNGAARVTAEEFWRDKGRKLDEVMAQAFGENYDPHAFWMAVEENLREGRMRVIIVGDEIRPEVRRIIEFLNEEMANVEVFGLELRCFGKEGGQVVLVPTLIGQTQATADRKSKRVPARIWQPQAIRSFYGSIDGPLGKRLTEILDWAVERGFFMETRSQAPGFSLRGTAGDRFVSVYPNGTLFVWLELAKYAGGKAERDSFLTSLNELPIFSFDTSDSASGRQSIGGIHTLDETGWRHLISGLARCCGPG